MKFIQMNSLRRNLYSRNFYDSRSCSIAGNPYCLYRFCRFRSLSISGGQRDISRSPNCSRGRHIISN